MAWRMWCASDSVLRLFASVDGLIASTTRTSPATDCRSPCVMRRGSISSVAPEGRPASAAAARAYGASAMPSAASRASSAAPILPSPTNSVARSASISRCARKTGLYWTSAPRRLVSQAMSSSVDTK